MPFNSLLFVLILLPGVLILYYANFDRLPPKIFLIIVSLLSYGVVQPRALPLLIVSIGTPFIKITVVANVCRAK